MAIETQNIVLYHSLFSRYKIKDILVFENLAAIRWFIFYNYNILKVFLTNISNFLHHSNFAHKPKIEMSYNIYTCTVNWYSFTIMLLITIFMHCIKRDFFNYRAYCIHTGTVLLTFSIGLNFICKKGFFYQWTKEACIAYTWWKVAKGWYSIRIQFFLSYE
jgi:hypothetical protein